LPANTPARRILLPNTSEIGIVPMYFCSFWTLLLVTTRFGTSRYCGDNYFVMKHDEPTLPNEQTFTYYLPAYDMIGYTCNGSSIGEALN
jgi:hypothetical protein